MQQILICRLAAVIRPPEAVSVLDFKATLHPEHVADGGGSTAPAFGLLAKANKSFIAPSIADALVTQFHQSSAAARRQRHSLASTDGASSVSDSDSDGVVEAVFRSAVKSRTSVQRPAWPMLRSSSPSSSQLTPPQHPSSSPVQPKSLRTDSPARQAFQPYTPGPGPAIARFAEWSHATLERATAPASRQVDLHQQHAASENPRVAETGGARSRTGFHSKLYAQYLQQQESKARGAVRRPHIQSVRRPHIQSRRHAGLVAALQPAAHPQKASVTPPRADYASQYGQRTSMLVDSAGSGSACIGLMSSARRGAVRDATRQPAQVQQARTSTQQRKSYRSVVASIKSGSLGRSSSALGQALTAGEAVKAQARQRQASARATAVLHSAVAESPVMTPFAAGRGLYSHPVLAAQLHRELHGFNPDKGGETEAAHAKQAQNLQELEAEYPSSDEDTDGDAMGDSALHGRAPPAAVPGGRRGPGLRRADSTLSSSSGPWNNAPSPRFRRAAQQTYMTQPRTYTRRTGPIRDEPGQGGYQEQADAWTSTRYAENGALYDWDMQSLASTYIDAHASTRHAYSDSPRPRASSAAASPPPPFSLLHGGQGSRKSRGLGGRTTSVASAYSEAHTVRFGDDDMLKLGRGGLRSAGCHGGATGLGHTAASEGNPHVGNIMNSSATASQRTN